MADHQAVPNVPTLWFSNCVVCGEETKKVLDEEAGGWRWVHAEHGILQLWSCVCGHTLVGRPNQFLDCCKEFGYVN